MTNPSGRGESRKAKYVIELKDCKHFNQSYTSIMSFGRPCEAYNTCLDCNKKLPPDLNRNFNEK